MKREKRQFLMPTKSSLKSRSSTINNAFVISITPFIVPDNSVLKDYYEELQIEPQQCGYCMRMGEGKTVDHINPLVIDSMPSGFITDINNLIPCCKDCNSKKGGKLFKKWYLEKENVIRLKGLGMTDEDINSRYEIISNYIDKHCSTPYSYQDIVGDKLWDEYCKRRKKLVETLEEDQKFCDMLNDIISEHVKNSSK